QAWTVLQADFTSIWGGPCPAAMTALAQYLVIHPHHVETGVLKDNILPLRKYLYSRYALLRRDSSQPIVWRGVTPLELDQAYLALFDRLWKQHGTTVSNDALRQLAGSEGNA